MDQHHRFLDETDWRRKGDIFGDITEDELCFYSDRYTNLTKFFTSKVKHYFRIMMGKTESDYDYFLNIISFTYEVKIEIMRFTEDDGNWDVTFFLNGERYDVIDFMQSPEFNPNDPF